MMKKSLWISLLIIIIVIIVIVIAIVNNRNEDEYNSNLNGTFIYNANVRYEFGEDGKGAMYDNGTEYRYNYSIEENILKLDFENENVRDATYTFNIENDILTLVGGEGTIGGEYILRRGS